MSELAVLTAMMRGIKKARRESRVGWMDIPSAVLCRPESENVNEISRPLTKTVLRKKPPQSFSLPFSQNLLCELDYFRW